MKRPISAMALCRRSAIEQRVVRILRGEATDDPALPLYQDQFERLRELVRRTGLKIHLPGSAWLGADELKLLSWLAQAQRVVGYTRPFHRDSVLTLTVVHCAGTLNALGIHLPAISLQHAAS